ncbi:ester cyclase [Pseudonocardia sp. DSM 110487]|uniref:ester cyclase n=1 Tax=Pseudonocardia sp. DSM 110487 TaxID=2865833 RepID=UPI001C69ECBE|nr:ester cyclase [Pseudonocardia sp. DSM 110487]QYN34226.1 ester cyclase [Pseudonocardia sp. DSM 110487]
MDTELAQLVRARVAFCNEGDWAAVRAVTGAGYAYREAGAGGRIDDIDDVLTALERLRAAAPDVHIEVEHVLSEGDVTVAQLAWSATLTRRRLRVVDRMWASWADGRLIAEWHEVGVLTLVAPLVDAELARHRVASAAPGRH